MITIHPGLFPVTAIVASAVLYGVFRLWMRMRCQCRVAQGFIVGAMCVALALTFLSPGWQRELERPIDPTTGEEIELVGGMGRAVSSSADEANRLPMDGLGSSSTEVPNLSPTDGYARPIIPAVGRLRTACSVDSYPTSVLTLVYLAGVAVMLVYFIAQIVWLYMQRARSQLICCEREVNVYETVQPMPYSCGGSIFLPRHLDDELRRYVLIHEHSHVRHRHFWKLCAVELLLALMWFNPFVWLFIDELKVQHEREVDEDVLATGLDRETYQLSLVRVAMKGSSWVFIQSHFGHSPLHLRILLMNRRGSRKVYRRNAVVATALSLAAITAIVGIGCVGNTEAAPTPLDGVWTMDWYGTAGTERIDNPSFKHYMTFGNNTFMCFTTTGRNGENAGIGFFGEEFRWTDSCVYRSRGARFTVDFKSGGNTFTKHWTKFPDEATLAKGPDIVEQWTRTEPDEVVFNMLRQMQTAAPDRANRLYGVWCETTEYSVSRPKEDVFQGTFSRTEPSQNDSLVAESYLCAWPGHVALISQTRRIDERINLGGSIAMGEMVVVRPDSALFFAEQEPIGLTFDGDRLEMRHHSAYLSRTVTTTWRRAHFPDDLRILLTSLPKE